MRDEHTIHKSPKGVKVDYKTTETGKGFKHLIKEDGKTVYNHNDVVSKNGDGEAGYDKASKFLKKRYGINDESIG